jgi:hypothetical protein
MELPHWLMVAGAIFLAVGFIGSVLRKNAMRASDPDSQEGDQASEAQMLPSPPSESVAS